MIYDVNHLINKVRLASRSFYIYKTMKYYGGSKCITIMADYVMVDVNLRAIIKI